MSKTTCPLQGGCNVKDNMPTARRMYCQRQYAHCKVDALSKTTRSLQGGCNVKDNMPKAMSMPWAKTINVFGACLGAQLAICAQK